MDAYFEKNNISGDLPFRIIMGKDSFSFPPHWHEEIELIYVLSGSLNVFIRNHKYTLKSKDILLVGTKDVHSYLGGERDSNFLILQFSSNLTQSLYVSSNKINSSDNKKLYNKILNNLDIFREELFNEHIAYKYVLLARGYDLISLILRNFKMDPSSDNFLDTLNKQSEILNKIFLFVEENFKNEINLEKLSSSINFSPYYLSRYFKKNTGISFNKYVVLYRLEKSKELLMSTDMPIIDIALSSGFKSVQTFNRVFKQNLKCSPSLFKKTINDKV